MMHPRPGHPTQLMKTLVPCAGTRFPSHPERAMHRHLGIAILDVGRDPESIG